MKRVLCIIPDFTPKPCDSLEGILQSALRLCPPHFEFNRGQALEVLIARERTMSNAGGGLAMPHASVDWRDEDGRPQLSVSCPVVVIMCRLREAIPWPEGSLDRGPVALMVVLLLPQGQFQEHLHMLADLSKFCHRKLAGQDLSELAFIELVRSFAAKNDFEEPCVAGN